MRRPGPAPAVAVVLLVIAGWGGSGCAAVPGIGEGADAPSDLLLPPGHGTLRQEQLTMTIRTEEALQLKVTPLAEWMIRLAAPDTYDRLAGLVAAHRPALVRETGEPEPALFLVSFFSDEAGTTYEPENIALVDRGRRYRPMAIRAVTSSWGTQRLSQRETRMAIYAFPPSLTMDMGLVLEYGSDRSHQWDGILRTLQAEHARARARAGSAPGPQPSSSSSNRLILR